MRFVDSVSCVRSSRVQIHTRIKLRRVRRRGTSFRFAWEWLGEVTRRALFLLSSERGCARVRDPFADRCARKSLSRSSRALVASLRSRERCALRPHLWQRTGCVVRVTLSTRLYWREPWVDPQTQCLMALALFMLRYSAGFMKRESIKGGGARSVRVVRIPRATQNTDDVRRPRRWTSFCLHSSTFCHFTAAVTGVAFYGGLYANKRYCLSNYCGCV